MICCFCFFIKYVQSLKAGLVLAFMNGLRRHRQVCKHAIYLLLIKHFFYSTIWRGKHGRRFVITLVLKGDILPKLFWHYMVIWVLTVLCDSARGIFFLESSRKGKSLIEFSLALMGLLEFVEQRLPYDMPNSKTLVRDQFVERG